MRPFTPYKGWEEDLYRYCQGETAGVDTLEVGMRLRAAFKPPTCGKLLGPFQFGTGDPNDPFHWDTIVCNLPAGHHPFVDVLVEGGRSICCACGKPASDSVHSPGHVPDVPEGAWR